ncbi:MAG TPA: cyclic nucleotide-binding domain-containing protein [Candidatus Bathyarchaeia archaeon]|nr:cyclic nucleotide-binding domain-containing protein [Candidatus Bathyarchaeia archaeon]
MSEPFDLQRLKIPDESPYRELLARCHGVVLRRYADDEILITEGAESREVFLVLQGACVVETAPAPDAGNRPETLAIINATPATPAFLGEMAPLGGGFRTASVRCSGAVFTAVLPPGSLDVVVNELHFFTRCLCRQFADRLREANQLIKDYQRENALQADLVVKQPGETIFKAGEPSRSLFQLVEGVVRLESQAGQKTFTAAQLPEGFLDPGPFFRNAPYESTATAETIAMLVSISNQSLKAVVRRYPDLLIGLYRENQSLSS